MIMNYNIAAASSSTCNLVLFSPVKLLLRFF